MGEFLSAKEHLETALELHQRLRLRSRVLGADGEVGCLSYLARALWHLGFPDQALNRIKQVLPFARRVNPHSVAWAELFAGIIHQYRQEPEAVLTTAEELIALSSEHGLPDWLAWATTLHGWALAKLARPAEGTAQLKEGLKASSATGSQLAGGHFLCLLAEACIDSGKLDDARGALAEAEAAAADHQDRHHAAEVHRLKGVLLLKHKNRDREQAEVCFHRAIEIARKQDSRALELRATISLARLLRDTNRRGEARAMLADIYGWFTEGFDTADLIDAKALLDQLSAT